MVDTNTALTIIFGSFLAFAIVVGLGALVSSRRQHLRKP
jgi:hypothetical protein